jgi:hypothetical protein
MSWLFCDHEVAFEYVSLHGTVQFCWVLSLSVLFCLCSSALCPQDASILAGLALERSTAVWFCMHPDPSAHFCPTRALRGGSAGLGEGGLHFFRSPWWCSVVLTDLFHLPSLSLQSSHCPTTLPVLGIIRSLKLFCVWVFFFVFFFNLVVVSQSALL